MNLAVGPIILIVVGEGTVKEQPPLSITVREIV
jgi:hypothetical protein